MTRHDLGNDLTSIVADGTELIIERTFAAPRELVWAMMTSPRHISNWWGPHGTHADVTDMDLRPGGRWRIATPPITFAGEFREVDPPSRFVRTSAPEMPGDGNTVTETLTLSEVDGGTKMVLHATFPSAELLDFVVGTGMAKGVLEQYDRLADLLAA